MARWAAVEVTGGAGVDSEIIRDALRAKVDDPLYADTGLPETVERLVVVAAVLLLVARRGLADPATLAAFAGALLVLTVVTWARDSMPTVLTPHRFSWQMAASQAANSLVTAAALGVALAAAASQVLAPDRARVRQPS